VATPTHVPTGPLITPLEPGAPQRPRAAVVVPDVGLQSIYATAFGRIEAAVASSRGSQHGSNEDAHSTLGGPTRMFIVADGVGGGAMAQMASRQLVTHLHAALDRRATSRCRRGTESPRNGQALRLDRRRVRTTGRLRRRQPRR